MIKSNLEKLNIKWRQEKSTLWLSCVHGEYYFRMPSGWKLEGISPNLLKLTEVLLFMPLGFNKAEISKIEWENRSSNGRIGIAFSGGADSSAAAIISPKEFTSLCYFKRDGFESKLHQESQLKCLEWFRKKGYDCHSIETNVEFLRTKIIKNGKNLAPGFLTDLASLVPTILMADFLGISYVTHGGVFDSCYMWKGLWFREFEETNHHVFYDKLFKDAGLPMYNAVGGITEIGTMKICDINSIPAKSCLQNNTGDCKVCYKCYRKYAFCGSPIPPSKLVQGIINKKPLKMGASMIYAAQKNKMTEITKIYPNVDTSFEDGYYDAAYQYDTSLPKEYKEEIINNINKYLRPMTKQELEALKKFNLESA